MGVIKEYVRFGWELARVTFNHAGKLHKVASWKRIRILLRAVREEPPSRILRNYQNLFFQEFNTSARSTSTLETGKGIQLSCDAAYFHRSIGQLEVHGWALAEEGIDRVEILENDRVIGSAEYGHYRPDVQEAYPDFLAAEESGYFYMSKCQEPPGEVFIRAYDQKGNRIQLKKTLDADPGRIPLNKQYEIFLEQRRTSKVSLSVLKKKAAHLSYKPLISIITPVFNVAPEYLDACISSVVKQPYEHWELCLYDDASTERKTRECLKRWEQKDSRIKVRFGTRNLHIAGASNAAVDMADGEFIALLDNDDELAPEALFEVVQALNENPNLDFIYSDEDKLEMNGTRSEPHFKPDFNPDLLLSTNYICHFSVIRKSLGDQIGWFRQGFEGAQDYDLFLRLVEVSTRIFHIPKVLYHWRKVPGSTAAHYSAKGFADEAAKSALTDFLDRNKIKGKVERGRHPGTFRIVRHLSNTAKVSIIIPFKDGLDILKNCLDSILRNTLYPEFEIILISNNSGESGIVEYARGMEAEHRHIRFFEYHIPFNYSRINNWAVGKASGEIILLLNNDTEVIHQGWLTAMCEHIQRPEVGAVGAKLLYPDKSVQHAGVVLNVQGLAGHVFKHFPDEDPGYFFRANVIQDYSACTAACLMVRKALYEEVGGMDEENLKVAFNDVDLCLKLREKGYLVVYTPFARLYHHESKSRGLDATLKKRKRFTAEVDFFNRKWANVLIQTDPCYNPNLSLRNGNFDLDIFTL